MGAVVRLCLMLTVLSYCGTQGQVISQPDDVTICEGGGAVFTCVLDITDDDDDDVQWYRLINDTSTTEIVDPTGENINFMTVTMENNVTTSSLTITNARISYTGYFWVGTSSLNICNASLTVGTSPSALAVNIMKNIEISSIDLQWDAVDDFLPTIYTIIWISERNIFQVATLIEQTSYTITGLTLDTAIIAANMCGSGPEFRVHISFSTDDTSTANTNSSITMTAVMINPTMATTVSTAIATNSTTNPAGTTTANENSNCNAAIIAGTTIGGILVVIIIVLILFITIYCFRRRKKPEAYPAHRDVSLERRPQKQGETGEEYAVVVDKSKKKKNVEANVGFPHGYSSLEQQGETGTQLQQPIEEYAMVDKSKKKNVETNVGSTHSYSELERISQKRETGTQLQQPIEYAIVTMVDNSEKKSKEDKQQNVETNIQHQSIAIEYAVVDKSKKKSRKEDKQQNGETDSQHQQPMEYAVVDDSKKKGDKQQNVHYAQLETLPAPTGTYIAEDTP